MRIASVGKGGSGKSTIVGTLARLLARDGEWVLALDVDTMPGLAYSMYDAASDAPAVRALPILSESLAA